MATATSPKADQPCLFTNAGDKEKAEPKKPKGTVFALPIDLDDDTLSEECAELHACVPEVAKAKADEKAAKNRGNAAKGLLGKFALPRFASEYATLGEMPPGPVTIVNHDGQSVTYVIQDKSQQNSLDDDQVAKLVALVGEEGVESITHEKEVYFFSSSTLAEQAAGVAAVKCRGAVAVAALVVVLPRRCVRLVVARVSRSVLLRSCSTSCRRRFGSATSSLLLRRRL